MNVEINGELFEIPLPEGSVEFENQYYPKPAEKNQYIIWQVNFEKYKEKMLDHGYVFLEQMGSFIYFENEVLGIRFYYFRSNYAHSERIVVYAQPKQN